MNIKTYRRKKSEVQAIQYTDVNSVDRIMDMIGTTGINNSRNGLFVRGEFAIKGDYVVSYNDKEVFVLSKEKFESEYTCKETDLLSRMIDRISVLENELKILKEKMNEQD